MLKLLMPQFLIAVADVSIDQTAAAVVDVLNVARLTESAFPSGASVDRATAAIAL
jgi:hypothetical protein